MYTVIFNGGKQYITRINHIVKLDYLSYNVGDVVQLNNILLFVNGDEIVIGKPYIYNCKVFGVVCEHDFEDKVNVLKFKRRKHHMKKIGHRQLFTKVKIVNIEIN